MRIVLDLQGAQSESRFRGIGRYSLSLARAIAHNRGKHEIILALNGLFPDTIDSIRAAFDGLLPQENIHVWHAPGPVRGCVSGNEWRRKVAELIREDFLASLRPDVVHVSSLFEGYVDDAVTSIGTLAPQILTTVSLYDLIPLLNPETYLTPNPVYAHYYQNKIEDLKRANQYLAISESASGEGRDTLGVPVNSIINISTACDAVFQRIEISAHEKHHHLSRFGIAQPFILYSGGADTRKNLQRLILAYAHLPKILRNGHQLVLAGKMPDGDVRNLSQLAVSVGISKGSLLFTGYITDDELMRLYNLCTVFVLPSLHEGFGLPALEAMSCGAAVIGANTTSIPEVIGRQDALFNPNDESTICQKLAQVLGNADFRNELAAHGPKQARLFSWNKCAKRAIEAFEGLLENKTQAKSISWAAVTIDKNISYLNLINAIADIPQPPAALPDTELMVAAACIARNQQLTELIARTCELPEIINWHIEGPFDSSYSLALLNRETARAIDSLGHRVILNSTEGPGDFPPNPIFLQANQDIAKLHARCKEHSCTDSDVTSRNLYPPRVSDMNCRLNLLHHYAWEESGFPLEWAEDFNEHLQGMTCLSKHVEKIMIDNGVTVPMSVSGCGVDHWEHIEPDKSYTIQGRSFRFLHVSSCFPRKGADILLKAYGCRFTSSDDVTLVIKTFPNPHNEIHKWLTEARSVHNNFPDVLIIEDDLTDSQLKYLYEQCHVLVAPSRAEGFGLPMAEAMLSGLGVITTGWSGQLDFCNKDTAWLVDYSFVPAQTHFELFDSVWAEPNTEQLARTMREVYDMPPLARKEQTVRGQQLLLEKFRWSDVASRLVSSARSWAQITAFPQPRIGWMTTWNTRCGIATYSAHLVENMPADVTILAANTGHLTQLDGPEVERCWDVSEDATLDQVSRCIDTQKIDFLVIQFNYGFFNLEKFSDFLSEQLDAGRKVILMMHSTTDPDHAPHKKLVYFRETLARCHRILVHAPGDLNRLKSLGLVDNVAIFPHGIRDFNISTNTTLQNTTAPKNDCFIVASYGFFLPHKGLLELIEAMALLRQAGQNIQLHMVNAEYPAPESATLIQKAKKRVLEHGLDEYVKVTTDFLSDDDCLSALAAADLIVFPYQNTGESSSAAVRYGLASGRPVAVTPLSIFDDVIPAVYTLPGQTPDQLAIGIQQLLSEIVCKTEKIREKETNAACWRETHRYSRLGHRLYGMFQALARQNC